MKKYFQKFTTQDWVVNALLAAVYVVLTVTPPLNSLAFGSVQFRVSEMMVMLPFYNRKFIPGLTLGCFITNLFSPTAAVDIFVGTLASLLVFLLIIHLRHGYWVPLIAAFINGVVVGAEIGIMTHMPFNAMLLSMLYIFIGEFAAVFIGYLLFTVLMRNSQIAKVIQKR
ncbi:QueT transporter family protein [Bombilactobacillus thymidiniphilus]|uniref:QueT transporter family protein n=1 Tax=Bombilactobacillus thymidiniphilus TaxID=2923363 RepID=A0ABY4PEU5_9LACO|nr:QueT transporter family protein [Bombilactobacillus thymidiniphilus]UQS84067.1 QueT transporter family protein [Bombilactobacillus thymidiniphilus]